jgi:hypothetical protein
VHVSWLCVPVPSLVFFWIAFILFCPLFPCSFFRRHPRMFCGCSCFSSFILSDASWPFLKMFFYFYLILYLRSIDHHILHRLGTAPTSSAALSLAIYICYGCVSGCICISAFINASRPRPFALSQQCIPHWICARTRSCPFSFAWEVHYFGAQTCCVWC